MMASDKLEEWQRKGIDFITDFDAFKNQVETGKAFRHQFLVLDNRQNQVDWGWLSLYINCLPYRIIVIGDIPDEKHLKNKIVCVGWDELSPNLSAPDQLKNFLWEKWVQTWWRAFKLCVRGGGNKDEYPIAECFYQEDEDPQEENLLVYDHKPNSDKTKLFEKAHFHECFTRDTPTYCLLNSQDGWMRWRVKEAAAISVGVLDERIFLEKDKKAKEAVSRYQCENNRKIENAWRKRRVYLFNHEDAINDFKNFVENLKQSYKALDFFVIHQGIIDAIKKRDEEKRDNKFSSGWKELKEITRWLIIDTGRGRPDQAIKECLRWVEYSNLADCLVQRAAIKYNLAQLLFALQAEFIKGVNIK